MSGQRKTLGRILSRLQQGAALSEFIVVLPALLLLGLGTLQTALIYHAKTTLNYATFEAARKGAMNHAQRAPMREELGLRLGPVFGGDGSVEKALGAITQASLDVRDPRYTEIEILNPTKEAFEDFGEDNPETGQREIPNSHLRWRDKTQGARSQLSIQDANLLKIKVTYGYRLRVPIIREVIAWTLAKTDPKHIQYYAARRLPITSVATLRMQSEAWAEGNGTSPPGGGGGTVPAGQVSQGDSQGGGNPGDDGQGNSSTNPATSTGDNLPTLNPDGTNNGNANACAVQPDPAASRPSGIAGTAVGNPIHVVTGNKYQHEIDLASLPGDLGLGFERHYNSQSAHKGILGYGWSHRYEAHLTRTAEGYRLRQSDGREIAFRPTEEQPASYRPARRGDGWLSATEAQITWHWPDGRQLRFDPQGRLDRIRNPQGREVRLHYNPQGHLYLIRDPQGRELALGYYPNGRLKQLIDPNGQITRYRYDKHGNLASVDYPDGTTRAYHYEDRNDRHNLTGLTDERGIRYATWGYDSRDRAISSEHAGGVDKVTLAFGDDETTVTDSQGNISTYHSEMREGVALVTRIDGPGCSTCGSGDVRYEYNVQFQLSARHDKGGRVSRYRYDEQGRVVGIDQTLPDGSTQTLIGYEYADAQQRQPSAIIRPSVNPQGQRRIEIGYNPQQQPTWIRMRGWRPLDNGSFEPIERTTRLSYDPQGNLIALDGPRPGNSDITRFTYDRKGYLKTRRLPDGSEMSVEARTLSGHPARVTLYFPSIGKPGTYEPSYDRLGRMISIRQGKRVLHFDPTDERSAATSKPRPTMGMTPGRELREDNAAEVVLEALLSIISPVYADESLGQGTRLEGVEDKTERLETYLDLSEAARTITRAEPVTAANYVPMLQAKEASENPQCNPVDDPACERIANGLKYGALAECTYVPATCIKGDWDLVMPEDIDLLPKDFHTWRFDAALLRNNKTGEYVLSFRGTDDLGDWIDDIGQGLGMTTGQYRQAVELAEALRENLPGEEITVTGHSLGGGLATAAALEMETQAYVFNPAGLHPDVAAAIGLDYSKAGTLVDVYHVEGELLTEIQDEWTGPAAPGERIPLPPPDEQWVQSHTEPHRFSWSALLSPGWWIIKGYVKRLFDRALTLHRMDAVLESLNRQAEALGCEQGYATGGGF